MSLSQRVSERVMQSDFTQIAMVYLSLHVILLVFSWPSRSADPNDAWFFLVQAKAALTAVLALAYGALAIGKPRREDVVFMLGLLALIALTFPLEFLAFVASFPSVPVYWAPLVQVLSVPAYYTLGLGLGWLLARLHLAALTPIIAALFVIGAFFFDLWLGMTLANPAAAVLQLAPGHLVFSLFLLALYGMIRLRNRRVLAV